jgi:acyl carrier protein
VTDSASGPAAERVPRRSQTSFTNDLNADSLDIVELLMEFENQFGTKIPDDQAEKIHTVGQAIDFIKANRTQPQG